MLKQKLWNASVTSLKTRLNKIFFTSAMAAMLGMRVALAFTKHLVRFLFGHFDRQTMTSSDAVQVTNTKDRCVLASLLWCVLSHVDTFFPLLGPFPTCNLFYRLFYIQAETVKILLLGNKIYTF